MGIHDGHRQRLKEEFLARPDSFPDHKVLELLLFYANPRSDTNETAHLLLQEFGSLTGVLDAEPNDLTKVDKVGSHAAVLIKAVKEISGRYLYGRTSMGGIIRTTRDAYHVLRPYFFGAKRERVCVLCTDGKRKLLGVRQVSEGDLSSVPIIPRLVAGAAITLNAAGVILAHNHVSGLAYPSPEDQLITLKLRQALEGVGIQMLDHLIFVDGDMVSMKDSGMLSGME